MTENIKYLLSPKSIAVIGATDRPGAYGTRATNSIVSSSIAEHVYFVNPKKNSLLGRKCYPDIGSIPEQIECAVVCVPAGAVLTCVEECGMAGVKAAVVYSSGFSEAQTEEGILLEQELYKICSRYNLALAGPNTAGIINKIDNISLSVGKMSFLNPPLEKGVAIICQSGFVSGNLSQMLSDSVSYVVGAGNGSVITLEDYVLYFAENENVNSIGIYIEGIRDVVRFEKALYVAAVHHKPVVVLKVGRSEAGAKAAASHTGNLAGNYKVCESIFKKYGVISVTSLEELVSSCRMMSVLGGVPENMSIAVINFSGGENTLCADYCHLNHLALAEYSPATKERMQAALPAFAHVSNPMDATTELFGNKEKFKQLLETAFEDKNVGCIVLGSEMNIEPEKKDVVIREVLLELHEENNGLKKPVFLIPSFERSRNRESIEALRKIGVVFMSTGELGYKSLSNLNKIAGFEADQIVFRERGHLPDRTHGRKEAFSEYKSKHILQEMNIPVPKQARAGNPGELRKEISGFTFPVVLKVDSPDILHKTEAGGVVLNIGSLQEAETAFEQILANCHQYAPSAVIYGVQIQEMVPKGVEVIVGVKNDIQFGPVLMAGLGGVFVELFKDVSLMPCPVNAKTAEKMLKELKGFRLLEGYRGAGKCDVPALIDVMIKVSDYAFAHAANIEEIDLNPVLVYEQGKGVCVADALIVMYKED